MEPEKMDKNPKNKKRLITRDLRVNISPLSHELLLSKKRSISSPSASPPKAKNLRVEKTEENDALSLFTENGSPRRPVQFPALVSEIVDKEKEENATAESTKEKIHFCTEKQATTAGKNLKENNLEKYGFVCPFCDKCVSADTKPSYIIIRLPSCFRCADSKFKVYEDGI